MKYVFILLMLLSIHVYAQSSSSESSSASSSSSSVGKFDIRVGWDRPTQREDGTPFAASEILGYEIRYKRMVVDEYRYIPLPYPALLKYQINNLQYNDYNVEIAVYDLNGLYSQFAAVNFVRPPKPPASPRIKASTVR